MNTEKILQLLGTTPQNKMETLHRMEEKILVSAEESANDLLNADLFGPKKARRSAKESVVEAPAPASLKSRLEKRKKVFESCKAKKAEECSTATEGWSEDEYSEKFGADNDFYFRKEIEAGGAGRDLLASTKKFSSKYPKWDAVKTSPAGIEVYHCGKKLGIVSATEGADDTDAATTMVENDILTEEGVKVGEFDYDSEAIDADTVSQIFDLLTSKELVLQVKEDDVEAEDADEAVATETVVETKSENFPDDFNFDEQAFADEYGIPVETISCVYVPEDPEAKVSEHIEVSFKFEDSTVTLSIMSDGTVNETVDAEVIEPAQFSSAFVEQEAEDGTKTQVLVLTLVDEDTDGTGDGAVKSEEDTVTKSEGDENHTDEDGKGSTDEFVEEAGLDIDGFYADTHGMKKADRSVHEVKAQESLAARIIRTSK